MGEEMAERIRAAIKMVVGVISVDPIECNFEHYAAVQQIKTELRKKLWEVLQ